MSEKRCYTVQELQEILGVSRPTVYNLLKKKEFRWIQLDGGKYRISKKSFDDWLVHKNVFESKEIAGKMRINIASFEKWYANQIKYYKVTGEEPGKELKAWSYSVPEIAEILEINDTVVYDLINKNNMEVVVVDYWKRIPKDSFQKWYDSQSRYRTKEDREKDAIVEEATITMPEMARLLGLTRSQVYQILRNPKYSHFFETIVIAEKKRITKCHRLESEEVMEILGILHLMKHHIWQKSAEA